VDNLYIVFNHCPINGTINHFLLSYNNDHILVYLFSYKFIGFNKFLSDQIDIPFKIVFYYRLNTQHVEQANLMFKPYI